jgi:hypothetical protein
MRSCLFQNYCQFSQEHFTTAGCGSCKMLAVLHMIVVIFFGSFGIIDANFIKCWELNTAQAGARGRERFELFIIPNLQTQSNRVRNFQVILLWLMLPRDHFVFNVFFLLLALDKDNSFFSVIFLSFSHLKKRQMNNVYLAFRRIKTILESNNR